MDYIENLDCVWSTANITDNLTHLGSKVVQNETQIIMIKCSNPNCLINRDMDEEGERIKPVEKT